jgi:ABC-type antimicrobial peptide transport system permease subunit
VVRSDRDPLALAEPLRQAIAEVDPALPVFNVATMESRLADVLATGRLNALLFSVLGAIALLLTLGGVYALTSFFVRQQEYEIGVRLALGATREQIIRRIVGRALRPVALGVILGLALATVLGRFLSPDLVGVEARDPLSLAAVLLLLFGTVWWASLVPARRTARVDPARSLRAE